ncbi:hypothetical protein GE061_005452 [Apolygus lucorum]|uniref:Uncharacterized protein n=1 Tax=Apolygus lucorum TaxID=248454 RepID=A0A8S9X0A2_APOLU|nr:hypothetical protein GE061_005452 [Apolygus lucorum]
MLDTVGIHGSMMEEESKKRRERQRQALEESTPKITEKWIALRDAAQESVDEAQARARARASKARLADLENEMDALVERTAAREKRLAGLRSMLDSESSQSTSDSSSLRLRKKITTVTTTTEKRSAK